MGRSRVVKGRYAAKTDEPFVVFVIGMRVNELLVVCKWVPTVRAMFPIHYPLRRSLRRRRHPHHPHSGPSATRERHRRTLHRDASGCIVSRGAPRRQECSGLGGEGPASGSEADGLDPAALLMGPDGETGEVALGELRIGGCHREQRLPQRHLALDTQR